MATLSIRFLNASREPLEDVVDVTVTAVRTNNEAMRQKSFDGRKKLRVSGLAANEPYMAGHFPDFPIMPGVLIVDALAQVAGIMLRARPGFSIPATPRSEGRPGVLAAIQRMRFFKPVFPGDRLLLRVRLMKTFGSVHQVQAEARVGSETVAAGELLLSS